jgi:hypothetical protein
MKADEETEACSTHGEGIQMFNKNILRSLTTAGAAVVCEDDVKLYKIRRNVGWIKLAQERDQWRFAVITNSNFLSHNRR